jgi:hypothetical protein
VLAGSSAPQPQRSVAGAPPVGRSAAAAAPASPQFTGGDSPEQPFGGAPLSPEPLPPLPAPSAPAGGTVCASSTGCGGGHDDASAGGLLAALPSSFAQLSTDDRSARLAAGSAAVVVEAGEPVVSPD